MSKKLLFAAASTLSLLIVACNGDDSIPVDDTVPETGTSDTSTGKPDTSVTPNDAAPDVKADAFALPLGNIDRMGRPAILTALLSAGNKNAWNALDTFAAIPQVMSIDIQNSLVTIDGLEGAYNWADGGGPTIDAAAQDATTLDANTILQHPLARPLQQDLIMVDTALPFSPNGYLEMENQFLLAGPAHVTCGGRWLNEDVMDKTLSLLVTKSLSGVSDGVNAATKPSTETFPYLASPN